MLVAGCAACAWPTARRSCRRRRPAGRRLRWAWPSSRCASLAFAVVPRRARAAPQGAPRAPRRRSSLAVAIQLTPLAGAAAALDRRLDVLGLRPDRRSARRRTRTGIRRPPSRATPRFRHGGRGLARHDLRLRACVHALPTEPSRSRPDSRPRRRRGSTRRSPRSASSPATVLAARLAPRQGLRARRSSAGTRCSRSTSRAAATTTRGWSRSCSPRSRSPRPAGGRLAGAAWALGDPRQVGAAPLLRAARARGAGDGPARRARSASRSRRPRSSALADARATGSTGCARSARSPATRASETSYAIPHRLEQLGVPHALAVALFARGASPPASRWLAREAARGRARLGLARRCCCSRPPYSPPGTRLGGAARRRRGGPPRAAALARASARTCFRRRFRSSVRRKTSTPSSAKTSRQPGCAAAPRARPRPARREAVEEARAVVSSTTTHSASRSTGS